MSPFSWSYTPAATLSDGAYFVYAQVIFKGLASGRSSQNRFVIDTSTID